MLEEGNVYTKPGVKKNWVMGHFIDPKTPFHQKDFSLKWTKSKRGDSREQIGTCEAETLDILVYGKHKIDFPNLHKSVTLEKEGDYVYVGRNIAHTWETLEDSLIVTLRWPSVPEKTE
ncbi:MAG: hypothetical protein A3C06_02770 [Candidatus Taylorbacteria bacterium RIFCSPHIGHO2_02_FULL_46_13]|uniref:Signal peptidase I n=1 Tax=Candidatus Taylorbacteria bacterium RIFCSPHIGHO2_02_FULL_46_13 TaxID=1802312 RepID=A0A1G2MRI8_9BACT|nr:MAG: hypothetical protein A3C06_02770 [Candidatus Taylorbacteria bacterium RIFCSPHIGHO2_02_FULL_46_13]